jgi:hypothetical protein
MTFRLVPHKRAETLICRLFHVFMVGEMEKEKDGGEE